MAEKVFIFKLINGEMLIAKADQNGETFVLKKPFQMLLINNQLQLADFYRQFSRSDNLEINKDKVVYYFESTEELSNSYIEASSGIAVATNSAPTLEI